MPVSPDAIKQLLAAKSAASSGGIKPASGGAPPPGGPQGVFDVSNDGVTWSPAVRLRAGSGTSFVTVNGETTVTAAALGATEYATQAAFRSSTPPADGTVFRIVSPPGEYRYSTSSGAGWADDGDTILKPDSVILGANGRAFTTKASAHAATFTAARAMKGLLVSGIKHVHVESHTTFGDGAGGVFDVKDNTGSAYASDNSGTILLIGTPGATGACALVRRGSDSYNVKVSWFGVWSGATDNYTGITAAINYLSDGGTLDLRGRGTLLVGDTVDLTNRQFLKILGGFAKIHTRTGANFTNKPIVNLIGSSYVDIEGLNIGSTITSNLPSCGIAIGRTLAHQGGAVRMRGVSAYGRFAHSSGDGGALYRMCAENSVLDACSLEGTNCPGILDASDDPLELCGAGYFLSNFGLDVINCTVGTTGSGSSAAAIFRGRTNNLTIRGGFFHSDIAGADAITFERGTRTPDAVNDQAVTIGISCVRTELATGWRVLNIEKPTSDLIFESPSNSSGATALVEVQGNGILSYSQIRAPRIGGAGGPVLRINGTGGCVYRCDITVAGANTIQWNAGLMTISRIKSLDGDPNYGTTYNAALDCGNILEWSGFSSYGRGTRVNGAVTRYPRALTGDTPDVGGHELINLNQGGPVTVTNFVNGFYGQLIIVKFDGNSTITHGTNIFTKAGTTETPAAGATRVYYLDSTVWREI